MHTTEQLISTAAAATLLDIHPKTCERLAREGKLPATKVGRQWRFSATALASPALVLSAPREPRPVDIGQQLAAHAPASPPLVVPGEPHRPASRTSSRAAPAARRRSRGRNTVQLEL